MAHATVFAPVPPTARSSPLSARVVAALCVLAAVFAATFVLAPGPLASSTSGASLANRDTLDNAAKTAFVGYWNSGSRTFTPDMARVVDYWRQYHVVKAIAAALLLLVAIMLTVRLWRALLGAGARDTRTRFGLAAGWTLATLLTVGSVLLVMANVQGSIAPLSSAITLLPFHTSETGLSTALAQIRTDLTGYSHAGAHHPPIVARMVDDFATYHAVIAVLTAIVLLVVLAMSVALWKRFRAIGKTGTSDDRRTRRLLAALGTMLAVTGLATLLVCVANTGTTADPAPALLALFQGGW
ncbi:hypothetical protein [Catenulispora rubra]|uniref:hypothetical protein n=1 Tax=Catenulispora rubra TaxID=280293 RepID=UPI001892406D|nr:hypothetical protein [Catenulispora rubra]